MPLITTVYNRLNTMGNHGAMQEEDDQPKSNLTLKKDRKSN